jgi:signal transduction histidine kinase
MTLTNLLFIGEADSSFYQQLQNIDTFNVQAVQQLIQVSHRLNDYDVMVADFSEVSSKRQIDRLRLQAPDLPLIVIVDRSQASMVSQLGDRVEDYLIADDVSEVLLRYAVRHAQERARLTESAQLTTEHLERVIEDQKILRRIERELGYTLNIDRVLGLAIDTATRLTAAAACTIHWVEQDAQRLKLLASLGNYSLLSDTISLDHIDRFKQLATVFDTRKPEVRTDGPHSHVILPLVVRGQVNGAITLERIPEGFYYDQSDWEFLIHLANRTATAIQTGRAHQRTSYQAEKLDLLYELSSTIAQHLNREDLLDASVAAMGRLLDAEGALFLDFQPPTRTLSVTHVYVAEDSTPPALQLGDVIEMFDYALLLAMLRISMIQIRLDDPTITEEDHKFIELLGVKTVLLAPLIAEDGTLKGVIAVYENRAERAFTTDEIALIRSFVGSVGVALRKAELFAAVQQLEQIKSEMIHMVSHDLRTPLSRILLSTRVVERKGKITDPDLVSYVHDIQETTQHMQSLLEDILSLEKIESEDGHNWKHFDVSVTLRKVADVFSGHVKLHQQDYILDLPDDPITVLGSEIQIQQAFSNYISNAIKYTPDGGKIHVKAYTNDGFLTFEVTDNGYGIPRESQAKIFNRFYRAKSPGTETISGTGLGLSLVRTVIERHGGQVWFTSEMGKGSTFSCSLPIKVV